MNKITVVGSINLDTTIRTEQFPKPGETIHSKEVFTNGGGKGANQAIAAARNDGQVNFIGAVGNDDGGKTLVELLEQDGINTSAIDHLTNIKTGSAYVTVDDNGENSIVIYGGANQQISSEHILDSSELISSSDYVIAQLETNLSSIEQSFEIAKKSAALTILNPAPALKEMPDSIIRMTDILIPNEIELETIIGDKIDTKEDLINAAKVIHSLDVKVLIVTLGSKGAFYSVLDGKQGFVPASKVDVVDTTAAGDTFIGALSTKLFVDFRNIEEAIQYANKAASLTVQRYGAQPSIPYESELVEKEQKIKV
ncbi:ribokinase [Enterococcus pallens]|uniref:Ribokinase n=1 Tax=Enterococcus pallens ATCC BAA-351 TaxID=1158607 RepID=R2SNT6_9ENTE|nr:ribokinase [Enterococcus pallens]EOH94496.1 ribokinase [Enterococcus pallens ATCC BAA-351]EOU24375.1 ribokinase [Enterococcus pallens ATCC BAA-351]OJG76896.1 ribokinase [Enterococcus pallens]